MAASSSYTQQSYSTSSPTAVAFSFDMDGALMSSQFAALASTHGANLLLPYELNYESLPPSDKTAIKKALELSHTELIDSILGNIPPGAHVYILSGSNRQSRLRDHDSGKLRNQNGCFAFVLEQWAQIIQEHLDHRANTTDEKKATVTLDGIMLEDLANDLAPGTCFANMLIHGVKKVKDDDDSPLQISDNLTEFDENKCMLLHTQMQHLANKHLETAIAFHFYDDDPYSEASRQILSALQVYLGQQIPQGLQTFIDKQQEAIARNINIALQGLANLQDAQAASDIEQALYSFLAERCAALEKIRLSIQALQQNQPGAVEQIVHALQGFPVGLSTAAVAITAALAKFRLAHPDTNKQAKQALGDVEVVCSPSDAVRQIYGLLSTMTPPSDEAVAKSSIDYILETLQASDRQPDRIPANVVLHLHEYVGPKFEEPARLKHKDPIQGAGPINPHYQEQYRVASSFLLQTDYSKRATAEKNRFFHEAMERLQGKEKHTLETSSPADKKKRKGWGQKVSQFFSLPKPKRAGSQTLPPQFPPPSSSPK